MLSKSERELAALSYLWIFSVLIYFSPHSKSKFIAHHSKQGIFLFVLSIIIYFLPSFLSNLNILTIFLMTLGIIESIMGNYYNLPIISKILKQENLNENDFNLYHYWKNKIINFYKKHQDKNKLTHIFVKTEQKKWSSDMKNLIKTLQEKTPNSYKWKEMYGYYFISKDEKNIFYIGGYEENKFKIAYLSNDIVIPGDSTYADWSIKNYNYSKFDPDEFLSLFLYIID